MSRTAGIEFSDGPAGRRAVVSGTGLDVWEVVRSLKVVGESIETLREDYPWLTDEQLGAAIAYYRLHPEGIDARLEAER